MVNRIIAATATILSIGSVNTSLAQTENELVEIIITEQIIAPDNILSSIPARSPSATIDSAGLLKTLPGANVNSNGPITGIAQYRGLYGDRVAVLMDGETVMSGGPNAMDAPLSYAPTLLLESLSATRGIASVSTSQESIGGELRASLDRGQFGDDKNFTLNSRLTSRHDAIDNSEHHGLKTIAANQHHKVAFLAAYDEGDDSETGNGDDLAGTFYQRQRYDLSYGWQNQNTSTEASIGRLETDNTGTPALPMDILYIDSDLANVKASKVFDRFTVNTRLGYRHVDHGMDNYSLRNNSLAMRYRLNTASAQQLTWGANLEIPLDNQRITVGFDATESRHDATITNPNMALFEVENFSNAERNVYGLFTQWNSNIGSWNLETGVRYNRIKTNSDPVSASGMMPMMQMLANTLATDFNNGDTDKSFNNIDVVLKADRSLSDTLTSRVGIGRKTRAPSYQERFLWLPLESTGGLADGRTYIGNLALDSEVSHEITLGLDWQRGRFYTDVEVFYRDIDDYIQGTPSSNTTANALALMMSGALPLQFNNIDAKLYGFDGRYGYELSDTWSLHGVLSLVRGRTDDGDNLYRIPPLNHRLTVSWKQDNVDIHLESVLYQEQTHTADFNDEAKTAGYGLINLRGNYQVTQNLRVSAGIENLFDKYYTDHLTAYNRNGDSSIALGERLPGAGRNMYIGFDVSL